jgi:hypothetical protein
VGCYHYSNFEWLRIVSAFAGLEAVVIAQQFKNPPLGVRLHFGGDLVGLFPI